MRLLFIFIYLLFFSGLRGQSYHQLTDLPTLYIEVYNGDDIIQRMKYMFNQDDFLGFACDGNKLVFDFYKPTGEASTVTWELEGV